MSKPVEHEIPFYQKFLITHFDLYKHEANRLCKCSTSYVLSPEDSMLEIKWA